MQLRRYWTIIYRRWLIVALVAGLALVAGGLPVLFGEALKQRLFTAEVRLVLNREPTQRPTATAANPFVYDDYYRFLSTEYLLDDAVERLKGNRFAQAVLEELDRDGVSGWSAEYLMTRLKAERAHRVLTIEATDQDRTMAMRLKMAVERTLTTKPDLLAPPDGSKVKVDVIHTDPFARSNLPRQAIIFAIQVLLGLLLGLGLAFLLHYLDDRVRDEEDLGSLALPLLGRLPAGKAGGR